MADPPADAGAEVADERRESIRSGDRSQVARLVERLAARVRDEARVWSRRPDWHDVIEARLTHDDKCGSTDSGAVVENGCRRYQRGPGRHARRRQWEAHECLQLP